MFKGKPFMYTWIYRTFDERLSFLDPMVTKAFLEKRANVSVPIATPPVIPETGWHPTTYSIFHDDRLDAHTLSLESLKRFNASNGTLKNISGLGRIAL